MNKVIKCYSYKRVSNASQLAKSSKKKDLDKDMRDSLVTQGENAINWVENNKDKGFVLDNTLFLEDRGVSAATGQNIADGKLRVFLDCCVNGTVPRGSYLLFDTWSRGSRGNFLQQSDLLRQLLEYDITIVTVYNGQTYGPEILDGQEHKIWMLVGEMLAANAFSNNLREKSKDTWIRRRRSTIEDGKVLGGNCPAWLNLVDGKYELIEDKVIIIRRIYEEYISGLGTQLISNGLMDDDIPTFSGRGNWTSSRIGNILKDKAVLGYHTFKASRLENNRIPTPVKIDGTEGFEEHKIYNTEEDVISSTMWERAQNLIKLRASKRSAKFNFTILEKLLECGYYLNKESKENNSKIRLINRGSNPSYASFQSDAYLHKYQGSVNQYWRQDCLEVAFLNALHLCAIKIDSDPTESTIIALNNQQSKFRIEYNNRALLISQLRLDAENIDVSKETRDHIYIRTKELEKERSELFNKLEAIKEQLVNTEKSLESPDDIEQLQRNYLNNMGVGTVISNINMKLRDKIESVKVFSLGIKYNADAMKLLITNIETICKTYNVQDNFVPINFKGINDLALKHFEYCPPLFFALLRMIMQSYTWSKEGGEEIIHLTNSLFMEAINKYPLSPTVVKYNRFFVVNLKRGNVIWFKTSDKNLERNNLIPICSGIDWYWNGGTVVANNSTITTSEDTLYYQGRTAYSIKANPIKKDNSIYNVMNFSREFINLQLESISPNLGKKNVAI